MNKRDDLAEKIVQNRLLTFVYKIPPAQGPPFKNTRKLLSARNLRSVGEIFFRESIVKIDVTFFRVCCSKTSAKKYRQQQTTFSWLHTRLVCCLTKQPPPHVLTSRSIKRFALRNTKRCFGDKQNETLLKKIFFSRFFHEISIFHFSRYRPTLLCQPPGVEVVVVIRPDEIIHWPFA